MFTVVKGNFWGPNVTLLAKRACCPQGLTGEPRTSLNFQYNCNYTLGYTYGILQRNPRVVALDKAVRIAILIFKAILTNKPREPSVWFSTVYLEKPSYRDLTSTGLIHRYYKVWLFSVKSHTENLKLNVSKWLENKDLIIQCNFILYHHNYIRDYS